jgi:hypothetical protein
MATLGQYEKVRIKKTLKKLMFSHRFVRNLS